MSTQLTESFSNVKGIPVVVSAISEAGSVQATVSVGATAFSPDEAGQLAAVIEAAASRAKTLAHDLALFNDPEFLRREARANDILARATELQAQADAAAEKVEALQQEEAELQKQIEKSKQDLAAVDVSVDPIVPGPAPVPVPMPVTK